MPFKLGNLAGDKIYLGNTEITKAYLGSQEVYSSGPSIIEPNFAFSVRDDGVTPELVFGNHTSDIYAQTGQISIIIPTDLAPHIKNGGAFQFGTYYSRLLTYASVDPTSPSQFINLIDYYDGGVLTGESDLITINSNIKRIQLELVYNENSGLTSTQVANNINSIWKIGIALYG